MGLIIRDYLVYHYQPGARRRSTLAEEDVIVISIGLPRGHVMLRDGEWSLCKPFV